jgi:hypothetical protein
MGFIGRAWLAAHLAAELGEFILRWDTCLGLPESAFNHAPVLIGGYSMIGWSKRDFALLYIALDILLYGRNGLCEPSHRLIFLIAAMRILPRNWHLLAADRQR